MAPTPKPWYRPRNVVLALLLLLVAWLGLETYRALTAKPGNPVDYSAKLNELVKSYQPAAGVNGWGDWMAALQTLEAENADARERYGDDPPLSADFGWPYDFQAVNDPDAPDELRQRTLEAIARLKAAGLNDQLARAAANSKSYRTFPNEDRLLEVLLPDLAQFRNLARYQSGRMQVAAAAGDWADFTDAFDQAMQSSHVLTRQGTLIDHLVGYAIQALILGDLSKTLAEHDLDAATLKRLADSLDRAAPGPIGLALRAEHIFVLNTIQWTHTDNGRGNGRVILSETKAIGSGGGGGLIGSLPDYKIVNVLALLLPSKKQTIAKADEFSDLTIKWAKMTPAERKASSAQPSQRVVQLPPGYVVLKLILPALETAIVRHDEAAAAYTQMRLTLAIERFRADRGEYPASLDELAPAYLDDVPLDPATGDPFTYERAPEEGPALGPYHLGAPAAEAAETSDPTSTP